MNRPGAVSAVLVAVASLVVASLVVPSSAAAAPAPATAGDVLVDPGVAGPYAVEELDYDLGDEAFAPQGLGAAVELRGRVYAPVDRPGAAPLVLIQHGRHATCAADDLQALAWPCPPGVPEVPSYLGYGGLARNLASHGLVVVSIGTNGINANDELLADGGAFARAQLLAEHLRRWQAWSTAAAGSPFGARFVGGIDLQQVGLVGHSRGGEGVAVAVELLGRTGAARVRAAVLLAPVDFGRRVLGGVETLVVLPACDGDVADLQGTAYYDDGRYRSPGERTARTAVLLDGANHNFFNTVWTTGPGSFDDADLVLIDEGATEASSLPSGPPQEGNCRAGAPGRLTAGQQLAAGEALMAGHLRRHLGPEPGLHRFVTGTAPYPASVGPARWIVAHHDPDRLDVAPWDSASAYRDPADGQPVVRTGFASTALCNPAVEPGLLGGPVQVPLVRLPCRRSESPLRVDHDTGVLDVAWVHPGAVLRQPLAVGGTDVRGFDGLRFRVALGDDPRNAVRDAQDLTVVLEDVTGARASVLASTGSNALGRLNSGEVRRAFLGGVRLPLARFTGIDLGRVRAVELRFDQTSSGRLQLADLAFTDEGVGDAVGPSEGPPRRPVGPLACERTDATRWGCAVAHVAWGRAATDREVARLAQGYATAAGRQATARWALTRPGASTLRHQRFALEYAEADVDPSLVAAVLSDAGRARWERALVDLGAGLSFTAPDLSTTREVIDALYRTLAGRPVDPAGLAHWTPGVEAEGPTRLARELVAGAAHRRRVVADRYQAILGRAPDPMGRAYWERRVAEPDGERTLVASLLATESFRRLVTA